MSRNQWALQWLGLDCPKKNTSSNNNSITQVFTIITTSIKWNKLKCNSTSSFIINYKLCHTIIFLLHPGHNISDEQRQLSCWQRRGTQNRRSWIKRSRRGGYSNTHVVCVPQIQPLARFTILHLTHLLWEINDLPNSFFNITTTTTYNRLYVSSHGSIQWPNTNIRLVLLTT